MTLKQKQLNKFRPYLSSTELDASVYAIEHVLNTQILDKELNNALLTARKALKKVQLNADAGIGIAYTKVAPENRKRSEVVSFDSLGGSRNKSGVLSDFEKINQMAPMDEEIFWIEQEVSNGFKSREIADAEIREIREKYADSENESGKCAESESDKYICEVIPTEIVHELGVEIKETTDSELFAALASRNHT